MFESNGPKGDINILVQFNETTNPNIYNLSFGNILINGAIDDTIINDNKDRNKILATVVATVFEFTSKYPEKSVYFCGSTKSRTRLYRMLITINYLPLSKEFHISGVIESSIGVNIEHFVKGKNFEGL
jgi:hypothetical protein